MYINTDTFETKHFKQEFWKWFDNLPKADRMKFKNYSSDMAELFFYNKVYKHCIDSSTGSEQYPTKV